MLENEAKKSQIQKNFLNISQIYKTHFKVTSRLKKIENGSIQKLSVPKE